MCPSVPAGGLQHLWAGRARRAGTHGADTAGDVVHLEKERAALSRGVGAPTDGSDTGALRPPLTWRVGSVSGTRRGSPLAVVCAEERRG